MRHRSGVRIPWAAGSRACCDTSCRSQIGRHTSELQSPCNLVCRLLLEKKIWRRLSYGTASSSRSSRTRRPRDDVVAQHRDRHDGPGRRSGRARQPPHGCLFFFNDTATTEIYPLSLHDALPISTTTKETGCSWMKRLLPRWAAEEGRSEEHTSELQSPCNLVCRLLLEKKNN